jgi:deoxyribose-phosphate aldolase
MAPTGPGLYVFVAMTTQQRHREAVRPVTPYRPVPRRDERNPGVSLDLGWIGATRVNRSAVERRVDSLVRRRSIKKDWQAAWLLRALSCIDLTTLAGDDTPGNVRRLAAKARTPVRADLLRAWAWSPMPSASLPSASTTPWSPRPSRPWATRASPWPRCPPGFPAGLSPFEQRVQEIRASVEAGAREIDIVITRAHVLTGDWRALYDEVRAFREAAGEAHVKTILATGELATLTNVARASRVCLMAGADFIKTSTGKEPVNATLPVGLVMTRAIRDYLERTGYAGGLQARGRDPHGPEAIDWLVLMLEELGEDWTRPDRFRFGASSLLGDIERQLEHFVTGRYSAGYRHPMA